MVATIFQMQKRFSTNCIQFHNHLRFVYETLCAITTTFSTVVYSSIRPKRQITTESLYKKGNKVERQYINAVGH